MARRFGLFLVIEGKKTEPWFYDEICMASPKIRNLKYAVYPVETVARGATGGGKTQVFQVFDEVRKSGALSHRTAANQAAVMFCVDADHDRIIGGMRRSKNITYTALPDVEAHIFDDFDIEVFLRRSYSACDADLRSFSNSLRDWRNGVARQWRPWFEMCLTAHYCGLRDPSPGTPPRVLPACGSVEPTGLTHLEKKIIAAVGSSRYAIEHKRAISDLDKLYIRNHEYKLLKGKWLPSQLLRIANGNAHALGLPKLKSAEAVLEAVKGAAKFEPRTTKYFHSRFEALFD
ncbi:hypothetical protein ACFWVM_01760 [Nocardia fluminea]|uniref:hypothetical protein n=1 Tax=Nocardia fluminea TaxID=134984 RepID=UPI0036499F3B